MNKWKFYLAPHKPIKRTMQIPTESLIEDASWESLYSSSNLWLSILQNIMRHFQPRLTPPRSIAIVGSVFLLAFFPFRQYDVVVVDIAGKSNFFDFKRMANTIRLWRRPIAWFAEWALGWYFIRQLRRADVLYVTSPDLEAYAKHVRKDAFWLPNIGKPNKVKPLPKKLFRVFIPTRFDRIKNLERMIPLLEVVHAHKSDYEVIMIDWGTEKKLMHEIQHRFKNVRILPLIKNPREYQQLLRSADLVFGQFHPGTAAYGRLESETILSRVPIVTLDHYESSYLREYNDKLEELVKKLITDKSFHKKFVERNYKEISRTHDRRRVLRLLNEALERAYRKRRASI